MRITRTMPSIKDDDTIMSTDLWGPRLWIQRKLLHVYNGHEKTSQTVKTVEILKRVRAIWSLHSCYPRMHSFSANQKRVIFSCRLLTQLNRYRVLTFNRDLSDSQVFMFRTLWRRKWGSPARRDFRDDVSHPNNFAYRHRWNHYTEQHCQNKTQTR